MVMNGPASAGAPVGCFNAGGAVSVTANIGLVILIVDGRPGTFRSGSATNKSSPFKPSAFGAE